MRYKAPKYSDLTPYEQGYRAYYQQYGNIDNPYIEPCESKEHEKWYDGWLAANRDDGN